MNEQPVDVAANLAVVRDIIAVASNRVGREGQVQLVAVTKTVPPERVFEAYVAGQRLFGENRVQEGLRKIGTLSSTMPEARWHLIGHLQTNKVSQAAGAFSLIESVDSMRLAHKLDERSAHLGRAMPVLLEVNVAAEKSKSGFAIDELRATIGDLAALEHLELLGLMTVAPQTESGEEVRPVFRAMRELRNELRDDHGLESLQELSMGMSGDFEVAIEEGSTLVRIGRAIFGQRAEPA